MSMPSIPWGTKLRLGEFQTFDEAMAAFDESIDDWHESGSRLRVSNYLSVTCYEYAALVEKPAEFVARYLRPTT